MKIYVVIGVLLSWCFSVQSWPANTRVMIAGVIPASVSLQPMKEHAELQMRVDATEIKKPIKLEKIILSHAAQQYLAEHLIQQDMREEEGVSSATLPQHTGLDMNGVPVLDQGEHGSCATFATTAVLDAILGHTDHISQLCNLELGSYLEAKNPSYPSGWDGSTNELVLQQIKKYGVISQDYQQQYGCAMVHAYPGENPDNIGHAMKVEDFTRHSENISSRFTWKTLLEMDKAFSSAAKMQTVLKNVKKAISNHHRVAFGVLVDENIRENGVIGRYKVNHDSWVLTSRIARDAKAGKVHAGHAMIITGYDDKATIIDSDNISHQGVLTLRNSWGALAGDGGNYYMSYDYFTALAMEAKEIYEE